jgi:hypothetical protein
MDRAEEFMVGNGASIKERTHDAVTFTRLVPIGCGEWVLMTLVTLFTLGFGILWVIARIAFMVLYPAEARLMARPEEGGTRLLVDGRHAGFRQELEEWVAANLAER